MTTQVLEVHGLGKAFLRYRSEWLRIASWFGAAARPVDAHWVVRDVSFSIARGEVVGVVGRNGAGKSTLLKILAGTLDKTAGRSKFMAASRRSSNSAPASIPNSPDVRTPACAGPDGIPAGADRSALPDIEAFAEIGEYFDQPTRIYSSGMQMRVAFAVATALSPTSCWSMRRCR